MNIGAKVTVIKWHTTGEYGGKSFPIKITFDILNVDTNANFFCIMTYLLLLFIRNIYLEHFRGGGMGRRTRRDLELRGMGFSK